MRKTAVLLLFFALATSATLAQESQEAQDEEMMFVLLNYVSVKPGMEEAFKAVLADHGEWHRSSGDTHYYNTAQIITGPRTGQFVWSAGPMTGEALDDFFAFMPTDMADWTGRGGTQYVDGVETHVLGTVPGMSNPPPADHVATMVNIYEFDVEFADLDGFMESIAAFKALEDQVGHDDYYAWTTAVSGDSLATRHYVQWIDSWADMTPNPARDAELAEAAGGQEAFQAMFTSFVEAIDESVVHTIINLPELSFMPGGQ